MYSIEVRKDVEKILRKLSKKDKISAIYVSKKVKEIQENPYRFKSLRKPLQNFWRVHIGGYVLIYSIDEKRKRVTIEKYEHHDKVYRV